MSATCPKSRPTNDSPPAPQPQLRHSNGHSDSLALELLYPSAEDLMLPRIQVVALTHSSRHAVPSMRIFESNEPLIPKPACFSHLRGEGCSWNHCTPIVQHGIRRARGFSSTTQVFDFWDWNIRMSRKLAIDSRALLTRKSFCGQSGVEGPSSFCGVQISAFRLCRLKNIHALELVEVPRYTCLRNPSAKERQARFGHHFDKPVYQIRRKRRIERLTTSQGSNCQQSGGKDDKPMQCKVLTVRGRAGLYD
ncbi:hypothetical protein PM082_021525 [Marasmius tenuissimus]|nr:hypothetical protein PM082_021525 [Marasmius tenuissimus]